MRTVLHMELTWDKKTAALLPTGDDGYEWVCTDDYRLLPRPLIKRGHVGGPLSPTQYDDTPLYDNAMIHGDAIQSMRDLLVTPGLITPASVNLIYMDPPFNTGQAFLDYTDDMERSMWLSMFRSVVLSARDLLSPLGSLWVQLDDHEQHHARVILDEVFGPSCFVATLIWDNFYKMHASHAISPSHNYIHVYAPAGPTKWSAVRNLLPGMDPTTYDPSPDAWALPRSVWHHPNVGHFTEARAELAALFPNQPIFATPKPERLLQRVIHVATSPGDTVLDCFAGSGTTSAVAHKMGRRWITIERSSSTIEKFTSPRLEAVIAGEQGGVSATENWTGGGGFTLYATSPVPPAH
jgi:DNA modification methylase